MLPALMLAMAVATPAQSPPPVAQLPPLQIPPAIARAVDPIIETVWSGVDMPAALDHVQFASQYWRVAGNAGYDAVLDRVQARLSEMMSGVVSQPATPPAMTLAFENAGPARGWDHTVGTLALVRAGQPDLVVLSRERERLALAINSFSTVPGGVVAPVVDVGSGARDADYAGKTIAGAVVLGDADLGQLWRFAVMARGAIGVVSTALPRYINPDPPGAPATPRETWDILQWGSVPYEESKRAFGFKASPRAAVTLRQALRAGGAQTPVNVRVTIASTFSDKPSRTLVAEIPGRTRPAERIVMAVHVQEPGANDNASGVGALTEMVRAIVAGIRSGRIPPPARTLTFLWLDEIRGSRQWLQDHAEAAKQVKYMFSLDMVGEDVAKTGGSFLIERWPDPNAVWDRPWDPHTEWGRGSVRADQLKGDLINDVHLAICQRVARRSNWIVKTNPYEGGSDHTVFGGAGIPSVLDWHFTDRYYHTNFDTADKTSAAELRNVSVAVAATAWLFASADEALALEAADLVAAAGQARLVLEQREGMSLVAKAADPSAAERERAQIVQAWRKWYAEAIRSVARLAVAPVGPRFTSRLEELAANITR